MVSAAGEVNMLCSLLYTVYVSVLRFAYVEFADKESVKKAVELDESLFRGRQIKVHDECINK